jgi:hypothetical protein
LGYSVALYPRVLAIATHPKIYRPPTLAAGKIAGGAVHEKAARLTRAGGLRSRPQAEGQPHAAAGRAESAVAVMSVQLVNGQAGEQLRVEVSGLLRHYTTAE